MKNGDIKDGLDTCERELDTAMNIFQVYHLNDLFYSGLTGSISMPDQVRPYLLLRKICLNYHYSSSIVLQSGQRDVIDAMRSNTAELQDLLIRALTIKSETQQIVEMQNAGKHVAERFMEAGQRVSYYRKCCIFQLCNPSIA